MSVALLDSTCRIHGRSDVLPMVPVEQFGESRLALKRWLSRIHKLHHLRIDIDTDDRDTCICHDRHERQTSLTESENTDLKIHLTSTLKDQ
jgi:hypothetical protein